MRCLYLVVRIPKNAKKHYSPSRCSAFLSLKDWYSLNNRIEQKTLVALPFYRNHRLRNVHFITMEELKRDHSGIPHGGFVIRSGKTGLSQEHTHIIEYSLKLDSNPEFTASVILAYARAVYRMHEKGLTGCHTVFDVSPRLSLLQTLFRTHRHNAVKIKNHPDGYNRRGD